MSKWQNYDYRAVTAGTVFLVIATIVLLSSPSSSLECMRAQDRCSLVQRSLSSVRTRSFPLKAIERARKQCDKSKGQAVCEWNVRLVVKGDDGDLFAGIKNEQEAERYVQAVRDFLDGRGPESMTLSRPAELTWVYILSAVGLLLIVLGIRKNLADKGVL